MKWLMGRALIRRLPPLAVVTSVGLGTRGKSTATSRFLRRRRLTPSLNFRDLARARFVILPEIRTPNLINLLLRKDF
jgi:hypothetical protein